MRHACRSRLDPGAAPGTWGAAEVVLSGRFPPVPLQPVTLEGRIVRLEPLRREHHAALCAVGLDPELWRWPAGHVDTPEDMRDYIEDALARQAAGSALPFADL